MSKAVMDSDGTYETAYTNEMFCPHCGKEQTDAWDFSGNFGSVECEHCGSEFEYERNVSVEYVTRKP